MTPTERLTSREVCARLGIHPSTLSRWVKEGRIRPDYQFPGPRGAFLFTPDEVTRATGDSAA